MTARKIEATEADVAWTEEATIALMHQGVPAVEAVEIAARACTERVLMRREKEEVLALQRLADCRAREKAEADARAKRRAEIEALATPGKPPTLSASLGDLLRTKRRA